MRLITVGLKTILATLVRSLAKLAEGA